MIVTNLDYKLLTILVDLNVKCNAKLLLGGICLTPVAYFIYNPNVDDIYYNAHLYMEIDRMIALVMQLDRARIGLWLGIQGAIYEEGILNINFLVHLKEFNIIIGISFSTHTIF